MYNDKELRDKEVAKAYEELGFPNPTTHSDFMKMVIAIRQKTGYGLYDITLSLQRQGLYDKQKQVQKG